MPARVGSGLVRHDGRQPLPEGRRGTVSERRPPDRAAERHETQEASQPEDLDLIGSGCDEPEGESVACGSRPQTEQTHFGANR